MKITVVTPRRPGVASGNDVTSARWARRLGELGHDVKLATVDETSDPHDPAIEDVAAGSDLLIALHARRSAGAVFASRRVSSNRPIVVGLAGTDLYADLPEDPTARAAIDMADHLVVLQDAAIERLAAIDPALGAKAHVVYQSVEPPLPERTMPSGGSPSDEFVVVVLAHLRDVKDPLLAAHAARLLPASSKVKVVHAGHAHDDEWRDRALAEEERNDRYHWIGEVDRAKALGLLASATVLACTSRLEGGANVVTEAIALGVPVVGTAIEGNWGLLGADYPGLVPVGGAEALARWLHTLETDNDRLTDLTNRVHDREPITFPASERSAWQSLMSAAVPSSPE